MKTAQTVKDIDMIDNPAIKGRQEHYEVVTVDTAKILKSWRDSLFAYEWMTPSGSLKNAADLPEEQKQKRDMVEKQIADGEALQRPVLGIGLMENVEIGAGKAEFLTLAALGYEAVSVHISRNNSDEFEKFII